MLPGGMAAATRIECNLRVPTYLPLKPFYLERTKAHRRQPAASIELRPYPFTWTAKRPSREIWISRVDKGRRATLTASFRAPANNIMDNVP